MDTLEKAVESLSKEGINLDYNLDDNSIRCARKKRAKVICYGKLTQAHCYAQLREIHLGLDRDMKTFKKELIHEKTHIDIWPYDSISWLGLYATSMAITLPKCPDVFSTICAAILETFIFLNPLHYNGYSDLLVGITNIFRYRKLT
jgi:hypothetical protein